MPIDPEEAYILDPRVSRNSAVIDTLIRNPSSQFRRVDMVPSSNPNADPVDGEASIENREGVPYLVVKVPGNNLPMDMPVTSWRP